MSGTVQVQRSSVEEINFTKIFAIFWRQRKLIFFGTLAITLFAAALSFFIPKTYRSEAFYQLGNPERKIVKNMEGKDLIGFPITLYKKSTPEIFNSNRLYLFAKERRFFSEKDLKKVKANFQTAADIEKWITPVFAFSKEDLLKMAKLPNGGPNLVLGLSLCYETDSPQKALNFVRFFGEFIRDCLLHAVLYNYIKDEYIKVISELSENENAGIDLQFLILQNVKKMLDIKTILTKYPEAKKIDSGQVVSIQEGGFRFLTPITQLVGIESILADQRRELARLEREKEILHIRKEYFSKSNASLNQTDQCGEFIFSQLKAIKSDVFKNKDFSKGPTKVVFNNLNIDLQTFDLAFFTNCRFISGPTLPTRHIKPRKSAIIILTCFLSFFFFIVLALVLHWWQGNKKKIKSFDFNDQDLNS